MDKSGADSRMNMLRYISINVIEINKKTFYMKEQRLNENHVLI